jgi:hypothetical protein
MGLLAMILAILAGLCGVMGILTATCVIDPLMCGEVINCATCELGWLFWFGLSAILFIATIAVRVGRGE